MSQLLARAPEQVVFGTAGHVDHGKTTLVAALTGTDCDRLPEERRRGLTIELGFAFLRGRDVDQACDLAFIDCPGHVRFIRQAIVGMGSMAGCLLVVDAQQGDPGPDYRALAAASGDGLPMGAGCGDQSPTG